MSSPDDGHTFKIAVSCRGSYAVVGQPFHDADYFLATPNEVEVRAWDLRTALRVAAELPFDEWFAPKDEARTGERMITRVCAHCQGAMRGFSSVNDDWLCHPDEGPDCYRLVTVYHHPMPCLQCPGKTGINTLEQTLNPDGC